MSRVMIIGEDNPYGGNDFAMYHLPRGASGDRLRQIMGLPDHVYEKFTKTNLCEGGWNRRDALVKAARVYAVAWKESTADDPWHVICCGAKVRECIKGPDFFTRRADGHMWFYGIPHPSARNLMWNDAGNVERVRSLLRRSIPDIAWGST